MLADRQTAIDETSTEQIDEIPSEATKNELETNDDQESPDQKSQVNPARAALDFQLENIDGGPISLSDYEGKPVMVNFWATWCPPCRAEMPLIQEFASENQESFVVLAVNVGEERSTIEGFVSNNELHDLIFLLDPENSVAALYGVPGFPTSLFVDQNGLLQAVHIGELNRDLMVQYLAKIGVE